MSLSLEINLGFIQFVRNRKITARQTDEPSTRTNRKFPTLLETRVTELIKMLQQKKNLLYLVKMKRDLIEIEPEKKILTNYTHTHKKVYYIDKLTTDGQPKNYIEPK